MLVHVIQHQAGSHPDSVLHPGEYTNRPPSATSAHQNPILLHNDSFDRDSDLLHVVPFQHRGNNVPNTDGATTLFGGAG